MKKLFAFISVLLVVLVCFSACGNGDQSKPDSSDNKSTQDEVIVTSPQGYTYNVAEITTSPPVAPVTKEDFQKALSDKYKEDFDVVGDVIIENDTYDLAVKSKSTGNAIVTASLNKADTSKLTTDYFAAKLSQTKTEELNKGNPFGKGKAYIYYKDSDDKEYKNDAEFFKNSSSSQYNIMYVLENSSDFEKFVDKIISDNTKYSKNKGASFAFVNIVVPSDINEYLNKTDALSNSYRLLSPMFFDEYRDGNKVCFMVSNGEVKAKKDDIVKKFKESAGKEYSNLEIL